MAHRSNSATASDLTDRSFAFTSGAGPNLADECSDCRKGQAFTLQFGSFGGTNVGPVTLDSGGSDASGTVTLGSLHLPFRPQHLPSLVRGPQSGTPFTIDPLCKSTAMTTRCG